MPIYEYACDACAHQFETIQKASEEPLTECPSCGEPALRKLLSAVAFRLKGSGWYETDFKKDNKKNVVGGEAAPKDEAASNDSANDSASPSASDGGGESSKESSAKPSADSAAGSSAGSSTSGSSSTPSSGRAPSPSDGA